MIPRCGPSIRAGRMGERKVMATTRQPGAACFTSCGLEHTSQRLIEADATASIGAEPGEHSSTPATHPNGHRPRTLDTRVGRLDLAIPPVRTGRFLPGLLEPRRRIEGALMGGDPGGLHAWCEHGQGGRLD